MDKNRFQIVYYLCASGSPVSSACKTAIPKAMANLLIFKTTKKLLLPLCLAVIFNIFEWPMAAQTPARIHPQVHTVVIDPGHGGHDSGCLGSFSQEKNLALAIALKLRDSLQAAWPDMKIIMTRTDDTFIPLKKRADIANVNKADLFISIHCNFMPGLTATRGTETYVLGQHKMQENLDVAMRENSAILLEDNYEEVYDFDPNSPEGYIVLSMYQNVFLEQSIQFASYVEQSLHEHAGRRSRGVKQAGFLVLRETAMPSVLIETGFLSYGPEENYLRTEEGQEQVAGAVFRAFAKYKKDIEGNFATPVQPLTSSVNAASSETSPARASTEAAPSKTIYHQASSSSASSSGAVSTQITSDVFSKEELTAKGEEPEPKPSLTPPADETPAGDSEAVHFRVQLMASPREEDLSAAKWQNTGYLIQVIQEKGLYKYQAVSFESLAAARAACADLRKRGFSDAFVVAYRGGERVPLGEVGF